MSPVIYGLPLHRRPLHVPPRELLVGAGVSLEAGLPTVPLGEYGLPRNGGTDPQAGFCHCRITRFPARELESFREGQAVFRTAL